MTAEHKVLKKVLSQALSGRGAHVQSGSALEGLDWKLAGRRPEGAPHSVFQIVNHMNYWHTFSVQWLDGDKPPTPGRAAQSWPGEEGPKNAGEWKATVVRFQRDLKKLNERLEADDPYASKGARKTAMEILQLIASHNSYHLGQVALLRRMLGSWPPPEGGATW